MREFISRHPILDRRFDLHGYRLVRADHHDSAETALAALYELRQHGLPALTMNTRAYLPLSWMTLKAKAATLFSPDELVVELPPDIPPDEWLLEICAELKQNGYRIAAQYSRYAPELCPLLALCDVLKHEFTTVTPEILRDFTGLPACRSLTLLATGVSTRRDFEKACQWGFSLFQGDFYQQPIVRREKNISPRRAQFMLLMSQAAQPELDYGRVAAIVRHDLALSYRLLRVVNESTEQLGIHDIKQAVAYLGEKRVRSWISMVGMVGFSEAKPQELVVMSMVRARFCERIARLCGHAQTDPYFLCGMFSLMDAILNQPLPEILGQLPIDAFTEDTLLAGQGQGAQVLALIRALEDADFPRAKTATDTLRLTEQEVAGAYIEALLWAGHLAGDG